jgi:hypothetical protein
MPITWPIQSKLIKYVRKCKDNYISYITLDIKLDVTEMTKSQSSKKYLYN